MKELAVSLIVFGSVFIIAGIVVLFADRLPFSFGKLPGDISFQGKSGSVHFPLATCIIISIVLTLVVNIILRLLKG